jgi:glyoxylase-like metal-dependent hydrolase (beta-lactamase superfamily II)
MIIKSFVNSIFNSNTYLLYKLEEKNVWIVDPGSSIKAVISWINSHTKQLAGILLTHTHFDHIYGLNNLHEIYTGVNVFASIYAEEGMISEKLNGSLYMEIPFIIKNRNYIRVINGDKIKLWTGTTLNVIETPGHDRDCLSFFVGNNLFTGDSLIPGVKVHTKNKYSDKKLAVGIIKMIYDEFDTNTMIWPGHGTNCLLKDINSNELF